MVLETAQYASLLRPTDSLAPGLRSNEQLRL